jgi:hypothetical protein
MDFVMNIGWQTIPAVGYFEVDALFDKFIVNWYRVDKLLLSCVVVMYITIEVKAVVVICW